MSIKVNEAVREGIILVGTATSMGLGFSAAMANAIAKGYKAVTAGESRGTVTIDTIDGRGPDGLLVALGLAPEPETFVATFNVYPLGAIEMEGETYNIDLYVAELDNDMLSIAYCTDESFENIQSNPEGSVMSSLVFHKEDLEEVLSLLGQDFSELPSEDDVREAEQATKH